MKIPNGIFVFIEPKNERQQAVARTKLDCLGTCFLINQDDQDKAVTLATGRLLSQMADVIAEAKRLGWEF